MEEEKLLLAAVSLWWMKSWDQLRCGHVVMLSNTISYKLQPVDRDEVLHHAAQGHLLGAGQHRAAAHRQGALRQCGGKKH